MECKGTHFYPIWYRDHSTISRSGVDCIRAQRGGASCRALYPRWGFIDITDEQWYIEHYCECPIRPSH
jgi:hypothetical protein